MATFCRHSVALKATLKVPRALHQRLGTRAVLCGVRHYSSQQQTPGEQQSSTQSVSSQNNIDQLLEKDDLKSIYDDLEFSETSTWNWSTLDPTVHVASLCEHMHNMGLPWWSAIGLTGLLMRMCFFPLQLKTFRLQSRMTHHNEKIHSMQQKLNEYRNAQKMEEAQQMNNTITQYRKRHGIETWRSLAYSAGGLPFFVTLFLTARNLLDVDSHPDIIEGGTLWFTNLAEPTSFIGVPLLTAIAQGASAEVQQRMGSQSKFMQRQGDTAQAFIRWGMRAFFLMAGYWMSRFEAIYFCIWLPAAVFQFCVTLIQTTKPGRKMFNIPEPYEPPVGRGMKKKTKLDNFVEKFVPKSKKEKPQKLYSKAELQQLRRKRNKTK